MTAIKQMVLQAEFPDAFDHEATSMDIVYADGTTRGSDGLVWTCDRTGLMAMIKFFGPDSKLLWTWSPEQPMPVMAHQTELIMPTRVDGKRKRTTSRT